MGSDAWPGPGATHAGIVAHAGILRSRTSGTTTTSRVRDPTLWGRDSGAGFGVGIRGRVRDSDSGPGESIQGPGGKRIESRPGKRQGKRKKNDSRG